MSCELQELAENLRQAPNLDAFWNHVHVALQRRGASSILYGVLSSKGETDVHRLTRALIWKGTHKREYFDVFGTDSFLDNDLTARHCVQRSDVLIWHDPSNWANASHAELRRAEISTDLGFNVGFTVPSSHFGPRQIGGVGVSMPNIPMREFDKSGGRKGRRWSPSAACSTRACAASIWISSSGSPRARGNA